jgi:Protein of unknown function (DUF3800)
MKYSIFFDESGDQEIKVFAGFVAANDQWEKFELEWHEVLRRFSSPPLHMRTFAHSLDEFSERKGDEPRRSALLKALLGVIRIRTRTFFASAVRAGDFEEVATRYPELRKNHTPFTIAGNSCILKAARWANRYQIPRSDVALVFEDGAGEKKTFVRHAKQHLGFHPSFAKKDKFAAFQAADLLAFEYLLSNRAIMAAGDGNLGFDKLREPLKALIKNQPKTAEVQWGIHDKSMLEKAYAKNQLEEVGPEVQLDQD